MLNFSVILLSLLSVVLSQSVCPDLSSFKTLSGVKFQNLEGTKWNLPGNFKKYLFIERKLLVQKVEVKDQNDFVMRDLKIMKELSGLDPNTPFDKVSAVKESPIVPFSACGIDENKALLIFQEEMDFYLMEEGILKAYTEKNQGKRIEIMLDIISKMEGIHKKGFVHGKIQPESIWIKGSDFKDMRMSDFSAAGKEGEEVKVKTPYFTAPEYFEGSGKLSFKGDIYSLAVTFLRMELLTQSEFASTMGSPCSDYSKWASDKCDERLIKGIEATFSEAKGMGFVKSAMLKAANKDPAQRFQSMEEFKGVMNSAKNKYYSDRMFVDSAGGNPPKRSNRLRILGSAVDEELDDFNDNGLGDHKGLRIIL